MKTTLDLPDELMRAIKVRAAQQGRKMKDVVTELLRSGLSQTHSRAQSQRRGAYGFPWCIAVTRLPANKK